MADNDMRQELTILESKVRHLEKELHDLRSKNQNAAWKSENYIFYEGSKYICAHFIQNRKCLYNNRVRMPGFDLCININGKACRLLTKID